MSDLSAGRLMGHDSRRRKKERTEDALASTGEEGRGKLRKSAGIGKHELIRRYPNGETLQGKPLQPRAEHIGARGETRGRETSQSPEEKTSTEIPRVVASESGEGQTGKHAFRGCGTALWHGCIVVERSGKSGHRG